MPPNLMIIPLVTLSITKIIEPSSEIAFFQMNAPLNMHSHQMTTQSSKDLKIASKPRVVDFSLFMQKP